MRSDLGSNATPGNLAIPSLPASPKLEECIINNPKEELLISAISEEEDSSDTRKSDTLPKNDKHLTPKSQKHSPPQPKRDRPLSQKFIDEVLAINIMNIVGDQPSTESSLSDNNNPGNMIFKLECSTNKVFMATNYKFDKKSKLFIVGRCCW